MSIEKYCTIYESAEFLTSGLKQPISKRDVLDFAARGFIRLCMFLEENVELSRYEPDVLGKLEPIYTGVWFKGYIQIPKDSISLINKECYCVYAEVVDAICIGTGKESKDLPRNARLIIQKVKSYNSYTRAVVYDDGIIVKHKNTLVPAIDLQNFIAKNQDFAPNIQHAENLDKQYDKSRLWELADQVAEKIRNDDGAVSLNKVSQEMTKICIRDKNKDLLHGQKGWHNESWIKTRIKGWKDPILRK